MDKELSELKPKETGNVKKICNEGMFRKRLLDMGIIPGTRVEVVKVAPLGDPIDIREILTWLDPLL